MTRYLLAVNFEGGVVDAPMDEWKPEEITAHLDYYGALQRELESSGELVASEVLAGPDLAKVVTFDGLTSPVVTDGPFQEFKEWLAGYQIVDVESEARAIEIAAKISAVPGPGGLSHPAADPGPAGHGPVAVERRRDGDLPRAGGWRALNVPSDVEDLLRELAPQVLGALARRSGDFDAAEDAVQEALLAAADHWSRDGIPADPRGWLSRTARLRLIDLKRSEQSRRRRETLTAVPEDQAAAGADTGRPEEDDTLIVLFMCCHPALTPASAIALTLRAVGGLTTAEVARAFLVPEATMAQRISRAKARIMASGVPFRLPSPDEQQARLRLVLRSCTSSSTRATPAARASSSIAPSCRTRPSG